MFDWLRYFQLEKISFFIGFITATILWFIFQKTKIWFPSINDFIKNTRKQLRQQQLSGVLIAIKKSALSKAQNNHLANALFPLDEIIVKPKLLPAKQNFSFEEENIFNSEATHLLPYAPDSPFISRNFPVLDLTIAEALQNNASIIVNGIPGEGKTVALADFVNSLCQNKPECGALTNKTPFYFNIQDIDTDALLTENGVILPEILFEALKSNVGSAQKSKLKRFIQAEMEEENCVFIIDGFDLLSQSEFDQSKTLISNIKENHPNIPIVLTATNYWADLEKYGFVPLSIKPLSSKETLSLYNKWITHWNQEITNDEDAIKDNQFIVQNWINKFTHPLTKLEYTLLVWNILEGQIRGTGTLSLYENFFIKLLGNKFNREKLGKNLQAFLDEGNNKIKGSRVPENPSTTMLFTEHVLSDGLNGIVYFCHPDLFGYLVSFSHEANDHPTSDKIRWVGHNSFYAFKLAHEANLSIADDLLSNDQPPVFQDLLIIGSWLRHSSPKSAFRTKFIKKLVRLIQNPNISFNIRLRFLSSFAFANDGSNALFIKQLLSSNDETVITLGAIAAGMLPNNKSALPDLINALRTSNLHLIKCICLSLATFNESMAIHTLGKLLLSADENIRKLIAENLAFNKKDGYEILRDAMTMDDILVRRSAIFGLIHINEPWAMEIIEETSIQDSQWVVRNIAVQALELMNKGQTKPIPVNQPAYYDDPWLIQFASSINQGLSPDTPPTDVIFKALGDEDETNKLNALLFASRYFDDSYYPKIIEAINSGNLSLNEYAASSLLQITKSGITLPSPMQFGLF